MLPNLAGEGVFRHSWGQDNQSDHNIRLDDMDDVESPNGFQNGEILQAGTDGIMRPKLPAVMAEDWIAFNDLSDVTVAGAPTGSFVRKDVLGEWVPASVDDVADAVAGELDLSLDDLSDVTITSPTEGQILKYEGGQFVNAGAGGGGGGGALSSDDVDNDSNVLAGVGSVTDALNELKDITDDLQDQIDGLGGGGGGGFGVYRGAVVTNGTGGGPGILSWGTESIDTHNIFSSGQPTRLTVPAGVAYVRLRWYLFRATPGTNSGYVTYNGGGSPLNGTEGANDQSVGGVTPVSMVTRAFAVAGGDYFQLWCEQSPTDSFFEMEILG